MAHNINIPQPPPVNPTATEINDRRIAEARKWISDEMETKTLEYVKAHVKLLHQDSGVAGLTNTHMLADQRIATHYKFKKTVKAAQAVMLASCNFYSEKYFMWPVDRTKYYGSIPMDCLPERVPAFIGGLFFRVKVDPKEPNCVNRFVIDRVIYTYSFSQWSWAYDLVATADTDVI